MNIHIGAPGFSWPLSAFVKFLPSYFFIIFILEFYPSTSSHFFPAAASQLHLEFINQSKFSEATL